MQAAPDRQFALLQAAVGLAGLALLPRADPAGRLLVGVAGVVLLAVAARALLLRPVLAAGPTGLRVVDGWRRRELSWSELEGARVVTDRRTPLLELDLGDVVIVLSRSRLGRRPADVLVDLLAARP